MSKSKNESMVGRRFGRLVVVGDGKDLGYAGVSLLCRCDCGNIRSVVLYSLTGGATKSCGCLNREKIAKKLTTHGGSKFPEYAVWSSMKARCGRRSVKAWIRYGGRGISVCSRWRRSFSKFIEDMGRRPTQKHQIDRVDNSGNYDPKNCRWVLPVENTRNSRACKLNVEQVRDIRKLLEGGLGRSVVAKMYGVSKDTVYLIRRGKIWREASCA